MRDEQWKAKERIINLKPGRRLGENVRNPRRWNVREMFGRATGRRRAKESNFEQTLNEREKM